MSVFVWMAKSHIGLAAVKMSTAQKEQTDIGNIGTRKSSVIIK